MSSIFIGGAPGSGKSTIAKLLAEKLGGVPSIDLDSHIEQRYGVIHKILSTKGKAYFRDIESNMLLEVTESPEVHNSIISLGGGSLLKRENLGFISAIQGRIILLTGNPDILYARILADTKNTRPLIHNEGAFIALMQERAPHYAQFDQQIIVDNKTPEQIVQEILSKYNLLAIGLPH